MEYRLGEETPFLDVVYGHSGLTNSEIDSIKEYYNKSKEEVATTGRYTAENQDFNIRKSKVVWMGEDFNNQFQTFDLIRKVYNTVDELNRQSFKFNISEVEPLQITKYDSNDQGFYSPHMDAGQNQQFITRKLSFVIQLSDPSDFEGGEFGYFVGGNKTVLNETAPQAIEKGMIILFPSFILHGVEPVTKGIRYSLVGWCLGERFK